MPNVTVRPELSLLQGNGVMGYDLSPDGNDLAFCAYRDGVWELCTVSLYGGEPAVVAAGSGHKLDVKWSPAGHTLAFVRVAEGGPQVCTVPAGGGEPQVLAPAAGPSWQPEWSPEGDRLAFVGAPAGVPELWLHTVETGASRAIAGGPLRAPGWSPDGAFICYLLGEQEDDLTLAYASGWGAAGSPRLLASGVCGVSKPRWSPAGRQIAVTRLLEGRRAVAVVSSATGRLTPLRGSGLAQWEPTWTSNGAALAYLNATGEGVGLEQQVLPAPGAGPTMRNVTLSRPDGLAGAALFTPGKPRALYTCSRVSEPPELYVQIVAGGHPQRLTSSAGSPEWLVGRPLAVPGVERAVQVGRPGPAALVWAAAPGGAAGWNPVVQDLAAAGLLVLQVELGIPDSSTTLHSAIDFCRASGAAQVGLVLDGGAAAAVADLDAIPGCAALAVRGGEFWPRGPFSGGHGASVISPELLRSGLPVLWLLAADDPLATAAGAMVQASRAAGQAAELLTCRAPGGVVSSDDTLRSHTALVQFLHQQLQGGEDGA